MRFGKGTANQITLRGLVFIARDINLKSFAVDKKNIRKTCSYFTLSVISDTRCRVQGFACIYLRHMDFIIKVKWVPHKLSK